MFGLHPNHQGSTPCSRTMKYFLIYKITNLINNKIYIGKHITNDIDDKYMGSGKILNLALKKYGIENFKKEIICQVENEELLNLKEKEIVNEVFLFRNDVYNIKSGGLGGFENKFRDVRTFSSRSKGGRKGIKTCLKNQIGLFSRSSRVKAQESMKQNQSGIFKPGVRQNAFKNHFHTEKTKKIIGLKASLRQLGKANSQFGKKWIHNSDLKKSISVKKFDIESYLNKGWKLGRGINEKNI